MGNEFGFSCECLQRKRMATAQRCRVFHCTSRVTLANRMRHNAALYSPVYLVRYGEENTTSCGVVMRLLFFFIVNTPSQENPNSKSTVTTVILLETYWINNIAAAAAAADLAARAARASHCACGNELMYLGKHLRFSPIFTGWHDINIMHCEKNGITTR